MQPESPSRTDPVVATMSGVVGGPVGERSAGHRWWSAARVLPLVTGVVLAAGMVAKSACVPSGWSKTDQPYAQLCWTDLAGTSVVSSTPPHVATWLTRLAALAPGTGAVATTAALAVLLAALVLLATALLVRVDPRRPWAAAGWAAAPILLAHWLSWQTLAAVGVAVLLWGWTTGRPWLAGVGAGIGAAFSLPVAAALLGVLVAGGRGRDRFDALLAAAAAYVLVTLPGRGTVEQPDTGSVWLVLQQVGVGDSDAVRIVGEAVGLALGAVGVWWVMGRAGWRATPATTARCGLLMAGAALLVAPSAPPEQALLLLPLAAIGVRRWRDLLGWQALHLLGWVLTGWYVGQAMVPTVADDGRAYWLAILLRLASVVWLLVAVLRDAATDASTDWWDADPDDPDDRSDDASVEGSDDRDAVEVGCGEADPDVDLLAGTRHPRA